MSSRVIGRYPLGLAIGFLLILGRNGSAAQLSPRQKLTIQQITSIFENGTTEFQYGYIEDIKDGAGVTCGRIGFTSEEIQLIVNRYSDVKNGDTPLASYLPCLRRMGTGIMKDYSCLFPSLKPEQLASDDFKKEGGLIAQVDFGKAWTDAGRDPLMRQVQDQYEEEAYYGPAIKTWVEFGLTTPLGAACIYDAIIQMDTDKLFRVTRNNFSAVHEGRDKPADIAEEAQWLRFYLAERNAELFATPIGAPTIGRVDSLRQILDSGNFKLRLPLKFTYENYDFSIEDKSRFMLSLDGAPFMFSPDPLPPAHWRHPSSLLRARTN
jgi:chitosanase